MKTTFEARIREIRKILQSVGARLSELNERHAAAQAKLNESREAA